MEPSSKVQVPEVWVAIWVVRRLIIVPRKEIQGQSLLSDPKEKRGRKLEMRLEIHI